MDSDNQIAQRILDLCKESGTGIPHDQLSKQVAADEQKIVGILNELIKEKFITVKQGADNTIVYQYQDPDKARKFGGLDRDTMAIYKLIADAQTNGLTRNDIKNKTGMNPKALDNILGALKKRFLIKSEKALNQKNRNVWILYELEPSISVKGNIFYKNGEFDQKLVDAISEKIFSYIQSTAAQQGKVSKTEISVFLRSTEFASLDLREEDIQSVINGLIFDDRIEEITPQIYKVCDWEKAIERSVLTLTPCGTCPVFSECREGGIISPEKCIYFLNW